MVGSHNVLEAITVATSTGVEEPSSGDGFLTLRHVEMKIELVDCRLREPPATIVSFQENSLHQLVFFCRNIRRKCDIEGQIYRRLHIRLENRLQSRL